MRLAAEADLFVLWRFGPYVCAEWPDGGVPTWVKDVPGMQERSNNTAWLNETQKWMTAHFQEIERFLPRNGGNVISSQLENENSRPSGDGARFAMSFERTALALQRCKMVVSP